MVSDMLLLVVAVNCELNYLPRMAFLGAKEVSVVFKSAHFLYGIRSSGDGVVVGGREWWWGSSYCRF